MYSTLCYWSVRYDTKQVTSLYSEHVLRYDLAATELNGALYLLGGQSLRFDVETDEWTLLEEEFLERKFFCDCAIVNNQIYLVSERKGNKTFPNMVLMDPYIDTCIEIDDAIPCPVPIRGSVTMRLVM